MFSVFWIVGHLIQFSLWAVSEAIWIAYTVVCCVLGVVNGCLARVCEVLRARQVRRMVSA